MQLNKLLGLLILCMYYAKGFAAHGFTVVNAESYAKRIVVAVNQYRFKHKLMPLHELSIMVKQAKIHSHNMARHAISFGHAGFQYRVKQIYSNTKDPNGAAENVAYFPPSKSPEDVVAMWLTSQGHRHNIIGNYNLTGVGVVVDKRGWIYYTQDFALATL